MIILHFPVMYMYMRVVKSVFENDLNDWLVWSRNLQGRPINNIYVNSGSKLFENYADHVELVELGVNLNVRGN